MTPKGPEGSQGKLKTCRLLLWLWHHPFEFTQKAFAALLGVERVALHGSLAEPQLPQLPHWGLLDPQNAFVTSTALGNGEW